MWALESIYFSAQKEIIASFVETEKINDGKEICIKLWFALDSARWAENERSVAPITMI